MEERNTFLSTYTRSPPTSLSSLFTVFKSWKTNYINEYRSTQHKAWRGSGRVVYIRRKLFWRFSFEFSPSSWPISFPRCIPVCVFPVVLRVISWVPSSSPTSLFSLSTRACQRRLACKSKSMSPRHQTLTYLSTSSPSPLPYPSLPTTFLHTYPPNHSPHLMNNHSPYTHTPTSHFYCNALGPRLLPHFQASGGTFWSYEYY